MSLFVVESVAIELYIKQELVDVSVFTGYYYLGIQYEAN